MKTADILEAVEQYTPLVMRLGSRVLREVLSTEPEDDAVLKRWLGDDLALEVTLLRERIRARQRLGG